MVSTGALAAFYKIDAPLVDTLAFLSDFSEVNAQ
jgi:hypothetical protein